MFQKTLEAFLEPENGSEKKEMNITERNLLYISRKLGGEIDLDGIRNLLVKIENLSTKEVGRKFLPNGSHLRESSVGKYIMRVVKGEITSSLQINQDISGWEDNTNIDINSIKY